LNLHLIAGSGLKLNEQKIQPARVRLNALGIPNLQLAKTEH
jgi:hypothetical protein